MTKSPLRTFLEERKVDIVAVNSSRYKSKCRTKGTKLEAPISARNIPMAQVRDVEGLSPGTMN